ncbi:MAG: putative iron-dependent peroxidase [Hyphomicrobiaceae bacterium]|jgi:putative iron-dependent peroxidase
MSEPQMGILDGIPSHGRYLFFDLLADADPGPVLRSLATLVDGAATVVGLGASTVARLGCEIAGLHELPAHAGAGAVVPTTPTALWLWLRGTDRGELFHRGRTFTRVLAPAFRVTATVDSFEYSGGRDLSGYEDGTENPTGKDALAAAFVSGRGEGLDGASFVAVQVWHHDLDRFRGLGEKAGDLIIGRALADNEELSDAPASAHVKRTAQETFDPPAFVLRRSMPWVDGEAHGLVFVAFGHSLDAFEALLAKMVGADDGVVDGLFRFTRPLTSAALWCPPTQGGRLDLSAVGL